MSLARLLLIAAVLGGTGAAPLRAETPLPPFGLGLTINAGADEPVYRGWPLLLRGDAALMEEVAAPFVLDLPSLNVVIKPVQGPEALWPLRRMTEFSAAPTLGAANQNVRVVWLLTAEQTMALVPGTYLARLAWAGRTSPPVEFALADAPTTLSAKDEVRRAVLQSQTAQYLGDTAGALGAIEPVLARQPDSIDLLVQCARVHMQRGEYAKALQATQDALKIFYRDDPHASHPPESILEVDSQAKAELLKGTTPGPRLPGLPGRGLPTVASPRNAGPAGLPPPPAIPGVGAPPSAVVPAAPAPQVAPSSPIGPALGTLVPASELVEAKILIDAAGQWAVSATAGSQYGRTQYSAAQATGAPNISVAGNSPDAWCPASKTVGTDWLEVTFAKPVQATEVRVRQNDTVGAISKIEAIEADGTTHVWWEGVDPYQAPAVREIAWFAVRGPKTSYLVAKVRVTLNLAAGPGWKEIDAVQLVGTTS